MRKKQCKKFEKSITIGFTWKSKHDLHSCKDAFEVSWSPSRSLTWVQAGGTTAEPSYIKKTT
jgi:hypothetical protein